MTAYHVYANSGAGDAIDYSTAVATITDGTSWNTLTLLSTRDYWFAVRAFDTLSGLEEQNIDCAVRIILDGAGRDITNAPLPPLGMRAFGTVGGSIKIEWYYADVNRSRRPTGFNIYLGTGVGTPNYSQAVASVAYTSGIMNTFSATLSGLLDKVGYAVCVRAYSAVAEEKNNLIQNVIARVAGPMPVVGLRATAIV